MKWAIFITARLKSKRLKKKILKRINQNLTVIEYLIRNLKKLNLDIYVITSLNKGDDELCKFLKKKKVIFFRGDPLDVMRRIYDCAKINNIWNIVSVTADNPFIDTSILVKMMKFHKCNKNDFTLTKGVPLGLYGYCLNVKILKNILRKKIRKNTEFWGGYILKDNSYKSKILKFYSYNDIINYRFTIDYLEDLVFCRKVLFMYEKKYINKYSPLAKELKKINFKNLSKININKSQLTGPTKYL
jgi:spore coat polysaccharide biosynthesis protein SpsF